jgi:glycosyltransferase involved in cell wall biosynthesis
MMKPPTVLRALWDLLARRSSPAKDPSAPVRVGFVGNTPEPSGGAEIFLLNLIRHLHGHCEVVALGRWQRQVLAYGHEKIERIYRHEETIERDEETGVSTYYLFCTFRKHALRRWHTIAGGIKLVAFILRKQVSVIHCHLLYPNIYFAFIASRLLRVPLIVTIHGLVDLDTIERSSWRRFALTYPLRRCDRVIAVSEEIRQACLSLCITNVEVRSCGIDTDFFTPEDREERGILFVGNLTDAKGFDQLLEAYREIREWVDEPLLLAGKNPANLEFADGEGIEYLGLLDPEDLREAFRRCKMVVFPSRTEGLPLTVLEAMACNKIVLAAPVGDLKRLIIESENGYLLSESGNSDLSARIVEILSDIEASKKKFGGKPREAARKFDIRSVSAWHRTLYENLVFARLSAGFAAKVAGISLRRQLILPALVRADRQKGISVAFRRLYIDLSRLIAWLVNGRGVRCVYLRRGMAKEEFMPLLSDIDVTVITDSADSKSRIERRVRALTKVVPMLEAQTPVLTLEEFESWSAQRNFAAHRTFLYRLIEAQHTWKALYSADEYDPLANIRQLNRAEIIATVQSEILFWNAIVVREYSDFHLNQDCPRNTFVLKRSAWLFMKATAELSNFEAVFRDHEALLFSRREILELAEKSGSRSEFYSRGKRLLDNQMDFDEMPRYLNDAHACLSEVYQRFHGVMSRMLDNEPNLIRELNSFTADAKIPVRPEYFPISMDELPDISAYSAASILAVCLSPLRLDNKEQKAVLVVVIESLETPPLTEIERIRRLISRALEAQGVRYSELCVDIIDFHGYLCFGSSPSLAPAAQFLLDRCGLEEPSLRDRFYNAPPPADVQVGAMIQDRVS